MGFRIGQYLLTPHSVVLPLALAFFVVLSYPRVNRHPGRLRRGSLLTLLAAILTGVAGAWLHAKWFPVENVAFSRGWVDVRFGSLGGYWGAFLGAIVFARLMGAPALASADAIVPGVLVGGAVARFGCLFAGCCRGVHIAALGAFDPSHIWPAYDLLALLGTAALIKRLDRHPARELAHGFQFGLCLSVYGGLRFAIEFARGLPHVLGPFDSGQVLSLVQVLSGIGLLIFIRSRRRAGES